MYKIWPLKVASEIDHGPLVFYLSNWSGEVELFSYMWLIRGENEIVLVDTGFTREAVEAAKKDWLVCDSEETQRRSKEEARRNN